MAKENINITDELIAAYMEGKTNVAESSQVLRALDESVELREALITAIHIDEESDDEQRYELIPMSKMAADGDGNLCDLQCEEYIMARRNIQFDTVETTEEARSNRWLHDKGTPLHNVGRLLEKKNLTIVRTYCATRNDMFDAINRKNDVIVVVNSAKLYGHVNAHTNDPNHAVIVINYDSKEETIEIFDPTSQNKSDIYSLQLFEQSWKDSSNYMVCVKVKDNTYNPHPIFIDDIDLTDDLMELREAIAENAHDVWAANRIKDGWTYGLVRDDIKKHNPDIVPYAELPEREKEYDRLMALNTIKLVKKLGYDMIRHRDDLVYSMLIKRLQNMDDIHYCSHCGAPIMHNQVYCEKCGGKITWKEIL